MKNKQWILKKFPVGEISEGDLVLEENEVPSLSDSQILIRYIYLSLDPANRGWMSGNWRHYERWYNRHNRRE